MTDNKVPKAVLAAWKLFNQAAVPEPWSWLALCLCAVLAAAMCCLLAGVGR